MLLRFEVSNHRSILDPVELSMIAVDEDRFATRGFERLSERVLTVAGIYGPNASGKSNVLEALAWLSSAVGNSLRGWDESVPRDPHRFANGRDLPSTFDADIVVDGVRHGYRLEVDDSAVLYESLHSYPERRRRTLFEREGSEINFRRGLSGTSGTQKLLTPTTLALSAAIRLGDSSVALAGRALAGMSPLGVRRRWGPRFYRPIHHSSRRLFSTEGGGREPETFDTADRRTAALDLLRFADPLIDDVEVVERDERASVGPRFGLQFVHQVDEELVPFELDDESSGTQTWFHLLGPTLGTLQRGRILLFDEIDASLHPRLSARLLELFQDPKTNPHGAQLVFTSHDTSLLGALNRDEVWLTEKDSNGATQLVAVADFGGERVRKSLNLERSYLQGRFGAIPEVDQVTMREVLAAFFGQSDD